MFNPFAPFSKMILERLVSEKKKYFVRQNFPRGIDLVLDENVKGCFIITDYESREIAEQHYGVIAHDQNRFLYDWDNPEHKTKLIIAASKPEGYKIYCTILDFGWRTRFAKRLQQKTRDYVRDYLRWFPKAEEGIDGPHFYTHYGELFCRILFRGKEVKIKFEEIEKIQ